MGNDKGSHHEVFDLNKHTFNELDNAVEEMDACRDGNTNTYFSAHCAYIPVLDEMIALDFVNKGIWSLNMMNAEGSNWENDKDYAWPKDLNTNRQNSEIVMGFGRVIYLFSANPKWRQTLKNKNKLCIDVRCIDTFEKKWYKSAKTVPAYFLNGPMQDFVSTGGSYAHFYDHKFHDVIDLMDLAPVKLQNKIKNVN